MGDEKVCYLIREAPLEGGQFFKGGSILLPPKSAIPLEKEFFIKSEANAESEHNFSRGSQFSKGPGAKKGTPPTRKEQDRKPQPKTKISYFQCLDALIHVGP